MPPPTRGLSTHRPPHPSPTPTHLPSTHPTPCSISVDDMRVEEMTVAHYLAFKEKLVPMEAGACDGGRVVFSGWGR